MLSAKRKSNGQTVFAALESQANAPFLCPECAELVILRTGAGRVSHFAHTPAVLCPYALAESETHRLCKKEIFDALLREPGVARAALERSLGTARPDVSANINGVPVAIEVQISNLSLETIARRTAEYARRGIYVLWLPQWTPDLDHIRYSPPLWVKWLHAAYFGRVYYWVQGLEVACYHFDPYYRSIPKTSWYSPNGKKMAGGGYNRTSKRFRRPIRGQTLNLAADFVPKTREWWKGGDIVVPFSKIFVGRDEK